MEKERELIEESVSKEIDMSKEEIEGYGSCNNRTQMCLTDCPWPFSGAYISGVD